MNDIHLQRVYHAFGLMIEAKNRSLNVGMKVAREGSSFSDLLLLVCNDGFQG